MTEPYDEALAGQLIERLRNVIIAVNRYRATRLEDARLESILTQLENAADRIEAGESYTYAEREALDFHLVEGSPIEDDTSLTRELYSLKHILDRRAGGDRPGYISLKATD